MGLLGGFIWGPAPVNLFCGGFRESRLFPFPSGASRGGFCFSVSVRVSTFRLTSTFISECIIILPCRVFSGEGVRFIVMSILLGVIRAGFTGSGPFLPSTEFFCLPEAFSVYWFLGHFLFRIRRFLGVIPTFSSRCLLRVLLYILPITVGV